MFGCALIADTELTRLPISSGGAHMGVLYMHHDDFYSFCGHVTFALARFLVDTADLDVFPQRKDLAFDTKTLETKLRLHTPSGVVEVTVPVLAGGEKCDSSRTISFLLTPSCTIQKSLWLEIPPSCLWYELDGAKGISISIAFGGAVYGIVPVQHLGFRGGFHDMTLTSAKGHLHNHQLLTQWRN